MAAAGNPPYKRWDMVPGGERNLLTDLAHRFGYLIGFTIDLSRSSLLLALANAGVLNMRDLGNYFANAANSKKWGLNIAAYPWAKYGLEKDEYTSASSIFGAEYKKVTGKDITQDVLAQAFQNPRDPTGSQIMTGSQYLQQLMQDASIQKAYGWVKYGMDYSAWQTQKLQMRTSLGRDVQDSEAATILQYDTQARGSNQAAVSRVPQPQQASVPTQGVGQSIVR